MTTHSKQGHTPTPWVIGPNNLDIRDGKHEDNIVSLKYQDHVSCEQQEANAAFIVRACNSHDALVEACKEMLGALMIMEAPGLDKYKQALAQAEGS